MKRPDYSTTSVLSIKIIIDFLIIIYSCQNCHTHYSLSRVSLSWSKEVLGTLLTNDPSVYSCSTGTTIYRPHQVAILLPCHHLLRIATLQSTASPRIAANRPSAVCQRKISAVRHSFLPNYSKYWLWHLMMTFAHCMMDFFGRIRTSHRMSAGQIRVIVALWADMH